jgi:predicted phage terminase large subunit-like protein
LVELPAIDEAGDALWPQKYPLERLRQIQTAIGERDWYALYQQKPQPDDGTYFKKEWFERYETAPSALNYFMTSDFAVMDGEGDYTEHTVWGVDCDSNLYFIENVHGQDTADVWINDALRLIRKYKPLCWFGEGGVIRRATEPFLKKAMNEQKTFCRVEWINPIGSKKARARAFQARAHMGKVFFPNDENAARCIDQLIRFDSGKYDDFVDTCSLIGLAIDDAHPAYEAPAPQDDGLQGPTFKDMMRGNSSNRAIW